MVIKKLTQTNYPKASPSLSSRPAMPAHDDYLRREEVQARAELWDEIAKQPTLKDVKDLIDSIRADFTPQQQKQLKAILRIGRVGLSEDETFKRIRDIVTSNDTYQAFKKHLIEITQNLITIRNKVLKEQLNSPERETLIKGINLLIQEAKLYGLMDLAIVDKTIRRYVNDGSTLEPNDLRHSALINIFDPRGGFLKNVDIASINPNTKEPYIEVPYAVKPLKRGALRELQNNGRTVRLPVQVHEALNKLRKLEENYSKLLPDNETKPKFLKYYAQQTGMSDEEAKRIFQYLKKIALFPFSLDYLNSVTFSDHRYGDESGEVAVELGNLIASTEPSPSDFVDFSLLQRDLKKILEDQRIPASQRVVIKLRYGIPLDIKDISDRSNVSVERIQEILTAPPARIEDLEIKEQEALELLRIRLAQRRGELKSQSHQNASLSLRQLGEILNLSSERIRQLEGQALQKLRQPARKQPLKDYMDPAWRSSGEIAAAREAYLSNREQNIEEARSEILKNQNNIEASKKIIENYQALLKAQMQKLLLNESVLEELLRLESPITEIYMYLREGIISFNNRTQHEQFIKLLGIYTESKTAKGQCKLLKEGIDWKNKELAQALIKNTNITNKETWLGFMEYLRNLSPSSLQITARDSSFLDAQASWNAQTFSSEIDLIKDLNNRPRILNPICSVNGIIDVIKNRWEQFGNNEGSILNNEKTLKEIVYAAIDRLIAKNKENAADPYEGVFKRFRLGGTKNEILQQYLKDNPETTFLEIYKSGNVQLKDALDAVLWPKASNIVPEIENILLERGYTASPVALKEPRIVSNQKATQPIKNTTEISEVGIIQQVIKTVSKSEYSPISKIITKIQKNNDNASSRLSDELTLRKIIYAAIDRLVKRNKERGINPYEGVFNFVSEDANSPAGAMLKGYLLSNPEATFVDMYQSTLGERGRLLSLDPNLDQYVNRSHQTSGKYSSLWSAILINEENVLTEIENILQESNNVLSIFSENLESSNPLTQPNSKVIEAQQEGNDSRQSSVENGKPLAESSPPQKAEQPPKVILSKAKISEADKKFIRVIAKSQLLQIKTKLKNLGVLEELMPELIKCTNLEEIRTCLGRRGLDESVEEASKTLASYQETGKEKLIEFDLNENQIAELIKCSNQEELQEVLNSL